MMPYADSCAMLGLAKHDLWYAGTGLCEKGDTENVEFVGIAA